MRVFERMSGKCCSMAPKLGAWFALVTGIASGFAFLLGLFLVLGL